MYEISSFYTLSDKFVAVFQKGDKTSKIYENMSNLNRSNC